jgi:hypothetical protein
MQLPFDVAVERAGRGQFASGRWHPHQFRVPRAARAESGARLGLELAELRRVRTFDELHDVVERTSGPIPGIGRLATYDAALRIGAWLGLCPHCVYLHAGTRDGVRALGLDHRRSTLRMDEVPEPLRVLTAREAEDFLCIYKSALGVDGPPAEDARGCPLDRTPPATIC